MNKSYPMKCPASSQDEVRLASAGTSPSSPAHAILPRTEGRGLPRSWVKNTEDGKRLWTYSGGDLNIGDLASSSAFDDEEFLAALGERGVEFVDCQVHGCEEAFSFDEVLAKAGELDEELQ